MLFHSLETSIVAHWPLGCLILQDTVHRGRESALKAFLLEALKHSFIIQSEVSIANCVTWNIVSSARSASPTPLTYFGFSYFHH